MTSLLLVSILSSVAVSKPNTYPAQKFLMPKFIGDVYGPAEPGSPLMRPMLSRQAGAGLAQMAEPEYWQERQPASCNFPLDIVLLQDATSSFADNINQVTSVELPNIIELLGREHPDTRIGVASFRDIPIWSLGDPSTGDYCVRLSSPLTTDFAGLVANYSKIRSNGGADGAEAQFKALVYASQSNDFDWRTDDKVAKLVIMITDAQPHYDLDGLNAYGLYAFPGTFDGSAEECTKYYYPSPATVRDALMARGAYLATLVYDPEYQAGLPYRAWEWFNNFLGQSPDFLGVGDAVDGNFTAAVLKAIKEIEDAECTPTCEEVCGEGTNCPCPVALMKIRGAKKHVVINVDYE